MPTAIAITPWGNIASGGYRGFALNPDHVSGDISLSGTYTGSAPATVEARVYRDSDDAVIVDWTALTGAVISGGNWSGSILAPPTPGGASFDPYYIAVRDGADTVSATGTEICAVGYCIGCYGQSNMSNMTNPGTPGDNALPGAGWYFGDESVTGHDEMWKQVSSGAAGGNRVIAKFFNDMVTYTGFCCFGFSAAKAGASVGLLASGYNTETPDDDPFGRLKRQALHAGGMNGILWQQGGSNVDGARATPSKDYYATLINGIHVPIATALGVTTADIPFYICSMEPQRGNPSGHERFQVMQDSLLRCADYSPYLHFSHSNYDFDMALPGDGLHITPADGQKVSERFANSMAYEFGFRDNPTPWYISSALAVSATTTRVTMVHSLGTDFTPTSGITGFEISDDNGASWETCTGARLNPTQILLTHASLNPTRKLRYHYGMQPDITGVVKDNSSIAVPLTYTGKEMIDVAVLTGTRKPQPTWLENLHSSTIVDLPSASLYDLIDIYIGPASDDRAIFINVANPGSRTVTSLTIIKSGQPNITGVVDHTAANCGAITHAVIPSAYGKFVTARIQFSGDLFNAPQFSLYRVTPSEMDSMTKLDGDSSASVSDTTRSVSLTTAANGFMLAVGTMLGNDGSPSAFSGDEVWVTNWETETTVDNSFFSYPFGNAVGNSAGTNDNEVIVTFDTAADDVGLIAASFQGNQSEILYAFTGLTFGLQF